MKRIVFIADFFIEDGVHGGAENCNDQLIKMFVADGYEVLKINSQNVSVKLIEKIKTNSFFIVANFMALQESCKNYLKNLDYLIYEHDHKYVATNDPSKFVDMVAPQNQIINREFYNNAKVVFCQSRMHAAALEKNILNNNIVNLGGNLWLDEKLDLLESLIGTEKTRPNGVLYSTNKNKGMPFTVEYCKNNNIDFEFIQPCEYEQFLYELAKTERIIMFPQWMETFNRVIIEGRILGCKFTTNKLIGATSEPWFSKYKGKELIDFLKVKRQEIYQTFVSVINGEKQKFFSNIEIPKISIITSLYKGEKYIRHFLEEVTKQTVFDKCELIILNANSPENEEEIIEQYCKQYKNIIYKKFDTRLSVQETMNEAIKMSTGELVTLWNVDDTRKYDAIEIMAKAIVVDKKVDLVYADSYQTHKENETFESNSSNLNLYEHSQKEFSKENMIKCLPGPMPLWRKQLNENCGLFDEKLNFAGDWEMWLRAVSMGSRFKKINQVLGLYYYNPSGLSTSDEKQQQRFFEERELFHTYREIFGKSNYERYKGYFR